MYVGEAALLVPILLLIKQTYSFEECCTEHPTLRLFGRDAQNGKDWDFYTPATKEDCMQGCLDKHNCVASMFDDVSQYCYEYYQTPRQAYDNTGTLTAFLCRTRAMQVCTYHPGRRLHADDPSIYSAGPEGATSDEACLANCKSLHSKLSGTVWDQGISCYCYLDPPGISYNTPMNAYMCSNRIVSCKAKNAKRNGEKDCERFEKLRLTTSYSNVTADTPLNRLNSGFTEQQCEVACRANSDCVAATYQSDTSDCSELTGNVPGQYSEPDDRFVSFLCE